MLESFGMEISGLVGLARQVGLALSGAAGLWGVVFLLQARAHPAGSQGRLALEWAAKWLLFLFSFGFVLASMAWVVTVMSLPVFGHEGVTVYPSQLETLTAFQLTAPLYVAWILVTLSYLFFFFMPRSTASSYLGIFFLFQFVMASVLISLYAWTGQPWSLTQIFFYLHGFHSIMTLGTVVTFDFTILSFRHSRVMQRYTYPLLPWISKVIWIGLGLDFLSVALVLDEALELVPRFFLAQTVVSLLIINGAFMSGPLTRRLVDQVKRGLDPLAGRWRTVAAVSGSISITSWLTITVIDFFPNITLPYFQLLLIYLGIIVLAYLVNLLVERFNLATAPVPIALETANPTRF